MFYVPLLEFNSEMKLIEYLNIVKPGNRISMRLVGEHCLFIAANIQTAGLK